ncbi:hypothetical protein TNCT_285431 [Trichonephila clavata]|uniref:Uncharacterized protein n=1 Tax=Trichonephila clavata TaxID=2740835 RepID=A0A8X6H0S4_TRICU|nr:hypothetical protein TNCT_285431 [Trichonephila clavata]
MILQEFTTLKTTTSSIEKELPVQISVAYARCPFIDRSNITFTGLGFHGIPDHLVLSFAGSLISENTSDKIFVQFIPLA